MKENYTTAAYDLITSGTEPGAVLKRLKEVMTERGHDKLYPAVLKALHVRVAADEDVNTPVVSIARSNDLAKHKAEIENALTAINAPKTYTTDEDPTIVGGFSVAYRGTMLDRTYKRALLALYRRIV